MTEEQKNSEKKYYCSECELSVIVLPNEEPIRACNCNAPILANMTAEAKGCAKVTNN